MQTLTINGQDYQIKAPEGMPLLWAIRDLIGLTGTKFGCGVAQCGACSIMIDGVVVRSCSTMVSQGIGKKITTIEGSSDSLTALRQAWRNNSVPQCGYCQSGQLMNAAAFLQSNPAPSDNEIIEAQQGNICRCITYNRIKTAIKRASEMMQGA